MKRKRLVLASIFLSFLLLQMSLAKHFRVKRKLRLVRVTVAIKIGSILSTHFKNPTLHKLLALRSSNISPTKCLQIYNVDCKTLYAHGYVDL